MHAITFINFLAFYFSGPPYPACTLSLEWKPLFLASTHLVYHLTQELINKLTCFVYVVARQDWVGTGNRATGEDLGLAGQVVLRLAVW